MKDAKPLWTPITPPVRPKTTPPPLYDVLPAEVLTCVCGRMWASADAKAQHIEQEHGGVEPEETRG